MKRIGLPADESGSNARYYALIDVYELAKKTYGEEFSAWLAHSLEEIDFLYKLTQQEGVVLMYGPGFSAPPERLRVSLANLPQPGLHRDWPPHPGIAEKLSRAFRTPALIKKTAGRAQ